MSQKPNLDRHYHSINYLKENYLNARSLTVKILKFNAWESELLCFINIINATND